MSRISLINIAASIFALLNLNNLYAQAPFFASTVGKDALFGYIAGSYTIDDERVGNYTLWQYGATEWLNIGTDLSVAGGATTHGYQIRATALRSKYINVGVQTTALFDTSNRYKYATQSSGLFLNGAILERLSWVSNTWHTVSRGNHTLNQWLYLTYNVGKFNPFLGTTFSWFDTKNTIDLAAGAYYSFGRMNLYAWCNEILSGKPRITIGLDFLMRRQ
ncbi:MAG: hypothetical protein SNI42_03855 [Rikenellaceae bacterium]